MSGVMDERVRSPTPLPHSEDEPEDEPEDDDEKSAISRQP